MKSVFPLVLAALLVCSLPAAAVPGGPSPERAYPPSMDASPAVEGGDWLAPSDDVASGSGYVGIDAGATLDADAARLESRYDAHRLDVRLERAASDAERRAIVREETSELERAVSSLSNHVEDVPGIERGSEFGAMAVETETMQGSVRERTAAALRGEIDPTRVYVEANATGVVLATVEDGRFHREAYRADARDPTADPRIRSLGESEERIAELYPEVFPAARWSYSEVGYGTHRGVGSYAEGTVTVYLDRATTDVYREDLTLRLDGAETAPLGSETEDGVRLSVEGTAPGGPAVVSLVNAETDAPLTGAVSVDGRYLGGTDDGGELWVVLPREPMTITASVGSTTIELTIDGSTIDEEPSADAG